jgi:hypothetical protein
MGRRMIEDAMHLSDFNQSQFKGDFMTAARIH